MLQETIKRILPLPEVSALVYGMRGHIHKLDVVVDLLTTNDCGLDKTQNCWKIGVCIYIYMYICIYGGVCRSKKSCIEKA